MATAVENLYRVCVKLYADEPRGVDDAEVFVPIFHEWIRDNKLDVVAVDVADYAHVPDGPGIMLVSYEAHFALDRADGRFGLLAQRRKPVEGGDVRVALAATLRHALKVAAGLEQDRRLRGRLKFDASLVRIELNDRLLAPNTDETYAAIEPIVREVVADVFGSPPAEVKRVPNDPRDRMALDVRLDGPADVQKYLAA